MNLSRAARLYPWQSLSVAETVTSPELTDEANHLASDFRAFIRAAWHVLEPGPLCDEWYIDAIADHMTAARRLEILNLWIHIRPRMLKTTICSVMFDAWVWTTDPSVRVLSASFSDDRRKDDCRRTRDLVTSEWYRARWPKVQLSADQNEKHRFTLTAGGQRFTAIYGSGATGDGGEFIRMDDPQCADDMDSPSTLEQDHRWFYSTLERRRNDPSRTPIVGTMQHLGPFDLATRLRLDNPNRWDTLSLESRRAAVLVTTLWRKIGERLEPVELPRTDTLLTRAGRFKDPRIPGDLLSVRIDAKELEMLERTRPHEYAAQEDQAPILATSEGAQVSNFDRKRHMARTFAERMGCSSLWEACIKALRAGWVVTTGWDHGQSAGRECCVIILHNSQLKEAWVVGFYANPRRTIPKQDATAVRRMLDSLGISPRAVVGSLGDVGNLGKGTTEESSTTARSINHALQTVIDDNGHPILGFPIFTPDKRGGSVARGVELLNMTFGSDGLFIDPSCSPLATALECWTGGEPYKDPCDALRYPMRVIAERWLSGPSGVAEM